MKVGLPAKKEDRHYTYGDYRTWPDDERWELINGVAYNMSPAPSYGHQDILSRLFRVFAAYFEGKPCRPFFAPADVLLPSGPVEDEDEIDTVVQPDLVVICDRSKVSKRFCLGAPELAIEILSPSTSSKDFIIKSALYERHGVKEYWIVDPGNRSVHLFSLKDGRYGDPEVYAYEPDLPVPGNASAGEQAAELLISSTLFPGLSIRIKELFEDLWGM